jgi:hypothetical protein
LVAVDASTSSVKGFEQPSVRPGDIGKLRNLYSDGGRGRLHAGVGLLDGSGGETRYSAFDLRKATDEEVAAFRPKFKDARLVQTGGASPGDKVVIVANAKASDAKVGEQGTFLGEGENGMLYVDMPDGKRQSYCYGDIRKIVKGAVREEKEDVEKRVAMRKALTGQSGRTGGAFEGDYVIVTPFARNQNGPVKPGEIGRLVDTDGGGGDARLLVMPLYNGGTKGLYYNGDIRRATFEDAKAVLKTTRLEAYTKENLRVFLICSLVKDVDKISELLDSNGTGLASLKNMTPEQRDDELAQLNVPVGARRKLEMTLVMAAQEIALAKLAGTQFKRLADKARFFPLAQKVVEAAAEAEAEAAADAAAVQAAAAEAAAAEATAAEQAKKGSSSKKLLSFMSRGSSRKVTEKRSNDSSSTLLYAYDADDLRGFLQAIDVSLVEYADVLEEHKLALDLLKSLTENQLEIDLRESGLPIGVRRKLALALKDAAKKSKKGPFSCMSSPKSKGASGDSSRNTISAPSTTTTRSTSASTSSDSSSTTSPSSANESDDNASRSKSDSKFNDGNTTTSKNSGNTSRNSSGDGSDRNGSDQKGSESKKKSGRGSSKQAGSVVRT